MTTSNIEVPKSTAATPSSAPSLFCSATTAATAMESTIAGRSGALKSPDNCQPTFNTLPTPPTAIIPKTSSRIRTTTHTTTTTIISPNIRVTTTTTTTTITATTGITKQLS
ncbi:uncharacterized protein ACN427_005876 isoform 1-T1 [Glossina fuscipes fuscipes]